MKCVVCTLFERDYHLGLAVFVNSLCKSGFRGDVYAGYRGRFPPWAEKAAKVQANGHINLQVTPDVRLIFVPVKTPAHLTNYKPDFMLQVEAFAGAESDAIVYCDPDLMVNTRWLYMEEWLTCGVAVCEDVNSPLEENHPSRVGWRRFFKPQGYDLRFRTTAYANGGFVGLTWNYRKVLVLWQEYLVQIAKLLGSSNIVGIAGGDYLSGFYGFANCFCKTDQDALNAVLEATPEIPISMLSQEAMGFLPGGQIIVPHALGYPKPWQRQYLLSALEGIPPSRTEKLFWTLTDGPLRPYSKAQLSSTRVQVAIGAVLGRVIKRTY